MLSILIPTYNYIIVPLVNQLVVQFNNTPYTYEIIIIDDCSTDAEIIARNKDIESFLHCTFIQNTTNKGRTATRQALAERAKYNWLLFMDADVLPKNDNFIKKIDIENQTADVVFGGISYEKSKPEKEKMLRWKYGKAREAKPMSERVKIPYLSIISGCILIKKSVFLNANNFHENLYGVDVLFTQNLEKMKVNVLHIDNPIVHLGLENSTSFIEKTKKGLASLYQFEREKKIPEDYRPIQKAYQSLNKNGALSLYMKTIKTFEKPILKNLKSSSPSLFLFDLYRLYYFANLKKQLS